MSAFADYRVFVSQLKRMTGESCAEGDWNTRATAALNGEASIELRRVVPLETRREFGAFFTGSNLRARLFANCNSFDEKSVFYDPSSGMGDLLLAAADIIPLGKTLPKTLKRWGRQLAGTDLHPEFIEGTKARLVLLARQRHGNDAPSVESYKELFPNIRIGNGLGRCAQYRLATHLLLNPPFGLVNAPANCKWAGGRVSEAALFVTTALERATPGTEILAILPDVLRSGSFTERWRNRVEELSHVHMVEPYGIFDESADVDVFLLRLIRRKGADDTDVEPWRAGVQQAKTTIADFFDVHVGRVVPHRDEQVGPRRSYIHPRCVPTWTVMKNFSETRKHSGLVYKPPFTVIRRTSRPGHPYRATATVIGGKKPLVVENHLIVCEPFDRKLATCKKLMQHLKSEAVNKYLDARIRCRHLTVDSVRTIPFEQ